MVYVFLADGFEESEALVPIDLLRRSGVEVRTVGITGKTVTGAHQVTIAADILPEEMELSQAEMIFLPGGMPGTEHLRQSPVVDHAMDYCIAHDLYGGYLRSAFRIIRKRAVKRQKSILSYQRRRQNAQSRDRQDPVQRRRSDHHRQRYGSGVAFWLGIVSNFKGRRNRGESETGYLLCRIRKPFEKSIGKNGSKCLRLCGRKSRHASGRLCGKCRCIKTARRFLLIIPSTAKWILWILSKMHFWRKEIYLPVCGNNHTMSLHRIRDLDDVIEGAYQIPVPADQTQPLNPEELDLVIVPGLSFDRQGYRMGYGGGYYDRFLSRLRPGIAVGICYTGLLVPEVPRDDFDQKCDWILTGDEVIAL